MKSKGTYDAFKKKKAELEKARRARQKQSLNELTKTKREQLIVENRIKCRERVELCRKRKKQPLAEINEPSTSTCITNLTIPTSLTSPLTLSTSLTSNVRNTYKTKSAAYKAVSKTKKSLPSSPTK